MEVLDLYNSERVLTGEIIERGKEIPNDRYRLIVHVVIFNSKGEMLLQKRSKQKKKWANLWDYSASGGVCSGEKSFEGAEREVFEELGLKIDLSSTRPSITTNFEGGFDDYYIVNFDDLDIEKLTLQKSEVSEVRWASYSELQTLLFDKKFISYQEGLINLLFGLRNNHYEFIIGD